jgi:NhaP-type Na+/H+ or K+/H+ antiporter
VGLFGPLVYGLWQFHKWITRYDPQTGYFGLDKVWVLLLEVALFVVLGAVLGIILSKTIRRAKTTNSAAE